MLEGTVDVAPYGLSSFAKDDGYLYGGDPVSQTVYELFTGFDDMSQTVNNEWISAGEMYGRNDLKKTKKYRFAGQIAPDQSIGVYLQLDSLSFTKIGTILGSGDYVDSGASFAIGTTYIGQDVVGGDDGTLVSPFLMEIKVRAAKFRKRKIKLVAEGFGYCNLRQLTDFDIWVYENRLPKGYRTKQNVSVDGATTDEDSPSY